MIEPHAANPPTCEVIGPAGDRLVVRPHGADDVVDDLRLALGVRGDRLAIDGVVPEPSTPLTESGLLHGSVLSTMPACPGARLASVESDDVDGHAADGGPGSLEWAVVAGPSCTPWRPLPPDRRRVGRDPDADLVVDDPTVEPHHGLLSVGATGATFTQLTGRAPALRDGELLDTTDRSVIPGQTLQLGSSRLRIRVAPSRRPEPLATASVAVADPWRRVVVRRRDANEDAGTGRAALVVPPDPGVHRAPPASGLVGAAVAAVGAAVLAVVLGHAMFAAFAAIGAVGAVATWAVGAIAAWRRRRRDRTARQVAIAALLDGLAAEHRRALAEHRAQHEHLVGAIERVAHGAPWHRRVSGQDVVSFTVGSGSWSTPPIIDPCDVPDELAPVVERARRLDDVPVPWFLPPGSATAVVGPDRSVAPALRSIVVQLAAAYGPADVRIVVVTADVEQWAWATWLPHVRAGSRPAVVDARDAGAVRDLAVGRDGDTGLVTILVTDVPAVLAQRTGDVRRFVAATGARLVVGVADGEAAPALCDRSLVIGATGCCDLRLPADESTGPGAVCGSVVFAGLGVDAALDVARRLAPLLDPEASTADTAVPVTVSYADVSPLTTAELIGEAWRAGGVDPAPRAVIGAEVDGVVAVDLVRDGPHALVAGTTGSGKSELLRTLVVSLAATVGPDHLHVVLVDFKGGSTFDRCVDLPHTVGVLTDLDGGLAERALTSLDAEVHRREVLLRSCGVDDLAAHRRAGHPPLARLVIVVDEFATLAREHPDVLASLVSIAQRGRSLGVHLVLATQRPAGVVTDDIRANTNLRLALRLHDRAEAIDVVDDASPASFGRDTPGRAALRLGPDDLVTFQAASVTGPRRPASSGLSVQRVGEAADAGQGSELDALVEAIRSAARRAGMRAPRRPWRDPLPAQLDRFAAWQLLAERDDELAGAVERRGAEVPRGAGAGGATRCDGVGGATRSGDGDDRPSGAVVGVVDDPEHQTYRPLRWNPGAGNLVLVGSLGSGTTSTLRTVLAGVAAHVYVVDAVGGGGFDELARRPNCGGVIDVRDTERLHRLLRRLQAELDGRARRVVDAPSIIVGVDGVAPLRAALASLDRGRAVERFEHLVRDGPALGIAWCLAGVGAASVSSLPAADRWVFHLDEPGAARSLGVEPVARVPGRLRVASSGLEAQVVVGHTDVDTDGHTDGDTDSHLIGQTGSETERVTDDIAALGSPEPIRLLPDRVDLADVVVPGAAGGDGEIRLVVGVDGDDLGPAHLHLPVGDHVLVVGEPQAGVTTALATLTESWLACRPDGDVRRVGSAEELLVALVPAADAGWRPVLVVVDDADRLADPTGQVAALLAGSGAADGGTVTVVAGARLARVRATYGHWTRDLARRGVGLLLPGLGDADGDLFEVVLPRQSVVAPRPGLGWLIDRTGHRTVQVAARMPS